MDPTWLDRLDMGFDDLTESIMNGSVPEFNDNIFKASFKEEAPQFERASSYGNCFDVEDFFAQPPSPTLQEDYKPTPAASPLTQEHLSYQQSVPSLVSDWMPCCDTVYPVLHPSQPQDIMSFIPPSLRPIDSHVLADRAADRKMRLVRYREKKKNRHFKKTIRYASRKAYAEVRPRVKGRFARKDEVAAMRAAGMLPCS